MRKSGGVYTSGSVSSCPKTLWHEIAVCYFSHFCEITGLSGARLAWGFSSHCGHIVGEVGLRWMDKTASHPCAWRLNVPPCGLSPAE